MDDLFAYLDPNSLLFRTAAFLIVALVHDIVLVRLAAGLGRRATEARSDHSWLSRRLDPLGLLMLVFGPYGWTRPLGIEPGTFRTPSRAKAALVNLAGILLYLAMAVLFWKLDRSVNGTASDAGASWANNLAGGMAHYLFAVSGLLFILNAFVPFYPTDLWKTIRSFVPHAKQALFLRLERIGYFIVIPVLVLPPGQAWLRLMLKWLDSHIANLMG